LECERSGARELPCFGSIVSPLTAKLHGQTKITRRLIFEQPMAASPNGSAYRLAPAKSKMLIYPSTVACLLSAISRMLAMPENQEFVVDRPKRQANQG